MASLNLRQKINLYLILSVTLLSLAGVPSVIPILGDMSEELNIAESKIGLLITVFTLPGAFLAPFIGMIIDRWGRKKVLLLALLLFGVSGTLCFFLRSFDMILVLRFFQGLGAACLGIVNITLIGDIYRGNQKAKAMGYNSGVMSVSMALFPAVGGLLASISWYYPFLIPALALLVAVLVYFYLDNPEPTEKPRLTSYLNHVKKAVLNRRAIMLFILSFATFMLLFGVIMTYLPILLRNEFSLSSKEIGFLVSLLAIVSGLAASQLNRLSRIFPMRYLIAFGFIAYLGAFIAIPYMDGLFGVIAWLLLIGLGLGLNLPAIFHLLTDIAPMQQRGAFMSVNSMAIRAGQTVGPVFAGLLFGLWGLSWVFWAGAILAFLFLLTFMFFLPSPESS